MLLPVFPVCLGLKEFHKWWLPISWSFQICSATLQFSSPPHRCFCWEHVHHVYLGIQICWIQSSFQFSSQALSSVDYIPLLLIIFPTLYSSVPQRNLPPYGCISILNFLGWEAEQRNVLIAMMGLGLYNDMWHILFLQESISPSYGVENILLFIFWIKLWAFLYGKSVP